MAYNKEIYERAWQLMEKRRLCAEQELEKRRSVLFAACPRAEEIERELTSYSVRAAKAVLRGADLKNELTLMKKNNIALQNELKAILEKNDLPENYLEPWYECELCSDKGNIDGKMCECMKTLIKKTAYEQLNSISPLSLCTFESFELKYYPDSSAEKGEGRTQKDYMRSVLNYCKKYADNFSGNSRSLIFQGGTGLGKTHLSLAIAQRVIELGSSVIYVSAPDIVMQLEKEHFSGKYGESGDSEQLLGECDLLILDDLGTEFQTKYTVAAIYNIINKRLLTSHPTIISTNLSLSEMHQLYGDRMVSRIIGMLDRIEFVGNDIRQLKRREKRNK